MISALKKAWRCKIPGILVFGLFILILSGLYSPAWSGDEAFPNRPVKIIIPFQPGAASDIGPRVMQDYFAEELKVPIILENKLGASGMTGAGIVLKARPDGHTIVQASDSLYTAPYQSPNPTYDPFRDFLPLGQYGQAMSVWAVHASSPFNSIADFIKEARKRPGELNVGTTVMGGGNHISLELFKKDAGLDFKIVPYKGSGPAAAALLGKHIDMLSLSYMGLLPYIKSGGVKVLVATGRAPGGAYPTIGDAGYPRADVAMNHSFLVSAKTPKPIYEKLVRTLEQVTKNPEVVNKLEEVGLTQISRSPAEYIKHMKVLLETRAKNLAELNIKGSN